MTDLNRATARLVATGHEPLLRRLYHSVLDEPVELNFGSLKVAKAFMRDLYNWMRWYPEVKARTSLRLDEPTITVYLRPRGISEKRGRRRL